MIIRRSNDRGLTTTAWLHSLHTFSFGNYYDPQFMGFGPLRVINEDIVQPGMGFGTHPHQDMEIISYVIEGALTHQDNMGTGSLILPGEIQRMSAGTGITHSEFNQDVKKRLHFLQIWILPDKIGLKPSYEQKAIPRLNNEFILLGSNYPTEAAVFIHQDVKLYIAFLIKNTCVLYHVPPQRRCWVQVIKGQIKINNETLAQGDGAALLDTNSIQIECLADADILLFDLTSK